MVNQILNMVMRTFMRKAINGGINKVVRGASAPEDMTPQERKQMRQARQATKRARQAARMMRRM